MKKDLEIDFEIGPVRKSLNILGGKWKLLIILNISERKSIRYGELKRAIPDISEKVLSQELKSLVEDNILLKKSFKEVPPKVEYSLTENGLKAYPIIKMLAEFGSLYPQ